MIRQLGGQIALIHVADMSQILPPRLITRPASQLGVGDVTMETIGRLAKRNHVAAATRLLKMGAPAEVLVASAAELKADLLVMGAVSRGGLGPHRQHGGSGHRRCDVRRAGRQTATVQDRGVAQRSEAAYLIEAELAHVRSGRRRSTRSAGTRHRARGGPRIAPASNRTPVTLDSSLDRDLGLDSLARSELLLRISEATRIELPDALLGTAERPRDLIEGLRASPIRRRSALDVPSERSPRRPRSKCRTLQGHWSTC